MSEPEQVQEGGMMTVSWTSIDLSTLDWQQSECATIGSRRIAIVQDADNKTWLVQKDDDGGWRELLDGELLGPVVPVRWAVPTWEIVQALAFG